MMGPGHRLLGALAGVSVASVAGQPPWQVALSGLIATATSAGWASPDVDQTKPWVTLRRAMPEPLDRALNHREVSHWPGWPLLAILAAPWLPADAVWPAQMLLVGWLSHLGGDAFFGTIPILPFGPIGPRVGLGLATNGLIERLLSPLLALGIVGVLLTPVLPVLGAAP